MAFLGSLLGIMGQLGRVVPNYVQGYRQAWQDNWNDANQYNQVQRGQLANLFAEAAFPYEYNMLADRAAMSRAQANQSVGNFGIYAQNYNNLLNLARQNAWYSLHPGTNQAINGLNQQSVYDAAGYHWAGAPAQAQLNAELTLRNMQNQMSQQAYLNNLYNNLYNNPNLFGGATNTTQTPSNPSWSQVWNAAP